MLDRFNGNVVPFASNATGTNRTIFGDTAQSDDIDDNLNVDFKTGWEIVGVNDNPTKQDFNALAYTVSNLISYIYQQGISLWNANQEYFVGSRVMASNGYIYRAKTGISGTPNTGNNPATDSTNWQLEFLALDNTISYTPTSNYHPATKKFVEDEIANQIFVGPSTDNAIARYNGVSGVLQNSGITIDDSNVLNIVQFLTGSDNELLVGQDASGYYLFTGFGANVAKPVNIGANATSLKLQTNLVPALVIDSNGYFTTRCAASVTQLNASFIRTWLDYNMKTNTIRGSANISSVTDNGTGDVTLNYITALPDTNYSFSNGAGKDSIGSYPVIANLYAETTKQTTSMRLAVNGQTSALPAFDSETLCIHIVR